MTLRHLGHTAIALCAYLSLACGSATAPPDTADTLAPEIGDFRITGDPTSAAGATWTLQGNIAGTTYDLKGILFKPTGTGPFPAVIVSHGNGGNANGYSRGIAQTMVTWGAVVIATNYTHAGGVEIGSPGTSADAGASAANVLRARKLVDVLRSLCYVDMSRIAAHGHSMGAFLTTALLGNAPASFLVASHSAGGIRAEGTVGAAPTAVQASTIVTPYQMHHGDADVVVSLALDRELAHVLTQRGVVHELLVYAGGSHADVSQSAVVLQRVRQWYTDHGLFR